MKIYNAAGVEIADVNVDDKSYLYKAIQETSSLTLYFSSVSFIEIPVGSYVEFLGETYYLESPENFKKHGSRNFEYTLILESAWARSSRYKVRNIIDGRLKFDLTATPADHLQQIVDNMNLRDPGWSVGDCFEAAEKLVSYNHIYCRDALQSIANEFNTEWEVSGKVISLKRIEYYKADPLVLSYGMGNGFTPGLGRMNLSDSKPVERLYIQGGERNIDFSKYNSKVLLLPKSQQLVYEGRTYQTDAEGLSVTRADKPVVFNNEDSLDLSHIYPSRVGEVSSVAVIDAANHFYDIIDNSIPADLDFVECLVAGETLTIIFQSGILAGREFEAKYIHAQRRFELVPQELDGQTMPNATFIPAAGDTYAVFGISLPDAYVCDNVSKTGASWDMFREAVKYLFENEDQKFSFTGDLDGIWAKNNWLAIGSKIKPGGHVLFSDTQFQQEGVLVRILSVKQIVNYPYSPVVELSNAPAGGSVGTMLKKIDANEVVTESLHKEAISFTKRRFRDSQETIKMIEAAFTNFSGSVNPVTVQTMALLVGDESLQFRFVDDMVTPVTVAHNVTFNAGTKVLTSPAGIIQHMTLGIKTISSSHAAAEYKFWNMALFESAALAEGDKSYYLYAKVSKTNQTGTFLLNENPIAIESVAGYYHLLTGILNMENEDGDRSYVDLYGYSEILPGRITTEKITSPDGTTFIDLINKVIQGKFSFQAGSTGYGNLTDKPDLSGFALQADVNTITQNLQAQIDGQITTYFDTYVPSLANAPASGWGTDAIKDTHLGDLFYNKTTGLGYRFSKTGAVYSWELLKDTDVALALANAATAQDTADGKRRVFVAQPVPPYDPGDLWSQGAAGDLMKCITARAGGNYNAADWAKASKYTDDTAVNNLQIGGRNLLRNTISIQAFVAAYSYGGSDYGNVTYNIENDYYKLSVNANGNANNWHFIQGGLPALLAGKYYTFSFDVKTNNDRARVNFMPNYPNSRTDISLPNTQGSWTRVFATAYVQSPTEASLFDVYWTPGLAGDYVCYKNLKFESGSKPTDFTAAPEDIDALTSYLRQAIQNNTTIQGGLLATTLIRLGAVNQAGEWIEKAGINGASGNDSTPRLYSGGSLADAIARVAGNLAGAKFVVTEGGKIFAIDVELAGSFRTAHTGARIEIDHASGAVIIYDANNVPKTVITSEAIPSLESLLSDNSASVDATSEASAEVQTTGSVNDTQYSAILTLPAEGSNYTITTPPIACICSASDLEGGSDPEVPHGASAIVNAYLVKPDNSEVFLGGVSATVSGDPGNYDDSESATIPSQHFSAMPSGNYKIKLYAQASGANAYCQASASISIGAPSSTFSGESVVSVSRIYRNGVFLVTDASHYHYISPTREITINDEVRGFGAIAAAQVASNGALNNYFNSIIESVDAYGGGLYTINHSIGHINYCPVVTPVGDGNYTATVFNVSANSFQVRTRSAGAGTNLAFYVKISG